MMTYMARSLFLDTPVYTLNVVRFQILTSAQTSRLSGWSTARYSLFHLDTYFSHIITFCPTLILEFWIHCRISILRTKFFAKVGGSVTDQGFALDPFKFGA